MSAQLPIEVLNIIFGYLPEQYGILAHRLEPGIRSGINSMMWCDSDEKLSHNTERLRYYNEAENGPITKFKHAYSIEYETFKEGESIGKKILGGLPEFVYKKLNLQDVEIRGRGDFNIDVLPESLSYFSFNSIDGDSSIIGSPDRFRNIQQMTLHDVKILMNLLAFRNLRVLSLYNNGDVKLPAGLRSLTCDHTTDSQAIPASVKYLRYNYKALMYGDMIDIRLNLAHITSLRYLKVWVDGKIADFHIAADNLKKISLKADEIQFNKNFSTDQLMLTKLKLVYPDQKNHPRKFGSYKSLRNLEIVNCPFDFDANVYPKLHHLMIVWEQFMSGLTDVQI